MFDGCFLFNFFVIDAVAVLALIASTGDARACPAVEEAVEAVPLLGLHFQPMAAEVHFVANLSVLKQICTHTIIVLFYLRLLNSPPLKGRG
jgi:hypothetical protein